MFIFLNCCFTSCCQSLTSAPRISGFLTTNVLSDTETSLCLANVTQTECQDLAIHHRRALIHHQHARRRHLTDPKLPRPLPKPVWRAEPNQERRQLVPLRTYPSDRPRQIPSTPLSQPDPGLHSDPPLYYLLLDCRFHEFPLPEFCVSWFSYDWSPWKKPFVAIMYGIMCVKRCGYKVFWV